MSVRRIQHCEHDTKPSPACTSEAKAICEDCGIGVCVSHITSHEKSCPNLKKLKDEENEKPVSDLSGSASSTLPEEGDSVKSGD